MRRWVLMLVGLAALPAQGEMWKCVDPDGNTRYTNVKADAKGCKDLNLDPINTAPGFRPPQKPLPPTAKFPSVDTETQRQRDAVRRKILEQELAQEQQLLDAAKRQLADQKDVRLGNEKNYARVEERLKPFEERVRIHEDNIASLRRELASTR